MASFVTDENKIRNEFKTLRSAYNLLHQSASTISTLDPSVLSMGMTSDYKIAIEEGSNMIRVGSLLFGERN
jgi:PLP dependent protein